MPEKQKPSRNWKNPKIVIAAISLSGLLALWNTFASLDRQQDEDWEPFVTPAAIPGADSDACLGPVSKRNIEECVTVTRSS
jgi:hypothetical protein